VSRFPKSAGAKRPYRLWNAVAKKPLRWRCYKIRQNAHIGALVEARWSRPGMTIEVYDVTTGRLIGQYKREANTVSFTRG